MWRIWWFGKDTINSKYGINTKLFQKQWYFKKNCHKKWTLTWNHNWEETGSLWYNLFIINDDSTLFLTYVHSDKKYIIQIHLTRTPCNYWWYRYWFICPNCHKKYVSLYLWRNMHFYCRKCNNLCYSDQNQGKIYRFLNKVYPKYNQADHLYATIKYKYRNGKMTRKYARYCKLMKKWKVCIDDNVLLSSSNRDIRELRKTLSM